LFVGAFSIRAHLASHLRPPQVRWEIPSTVSRDDLQIGKLVQRAVEDQARKKHGRLQRIADNVSEIAPATLPGIFLEHIVGAAGMHEDRHAELLQLGPEGIKLRQRERLTLDVPADGGTAASQ